MTYSESGMAIDDSVCVRGWGRKRETMYNMEIALLEFRIYQNEHLLIEQNTKNQKVKIAC